MRLEAGEEAEGGFTGACTTGDGEVVCPEVRCQIDELAEAQAHAKMVGAAGKALFGTEVVVVHGAILERQAFAAIGSWRKVEGSAARTDVGLHAIDLARVRNVSEANLMHANLRTGKNAGIVVCGDDGGRGRSGGGIDRGRGGCVGKGIVLVEARIGEVVLETDERLDGVSQRDKFADCAAGGDGKKGGSGDGRLCNASARSGDKGVSVDITLFQAANVGADDAGDADTEVEVLQRPLKGSERDGFLREGPLCGEAENAQ